MSTVYCSANHSPEQLLSWMQKEFGLDPLKEFTIVPFYKKLNPKKARSYKSRIIILCYNDTMRNFELFKHSAFKNKQFFVFAPPFRCAEIGNSVWLDFQNDAELKGIAYQMTDWQKEKFNPDVRAGAKREPVFKVNEGFQTKVIDQVKSVGSIMSSLQTLVYTLPKRAMQKPVTHAFCKWMYNGDSAEDLDLIINNLRFEINLTKRKADKFREMLLGEDGQKAQQAFELIRAAQESGKSVDYKGIGHQVGIHAFDLRYIMRVVRTDDEYSELENTTMTEFYEKTQAKAEAAKAKAAAKIEEAEAQEEQVEEDPQPARRRKPKQKRGNTRGTSTRNTGTKKRKRRTTRAK